MVTYEFLCPKCQKLYTALQEMLDEHVYDCPECGTKCDRQYSFSIGPIDWVNGGWHGDDINMGLGKHYKSAKERDYDAASHGLVKA